MPFEQHKNSKSEFQTKLKSRISSQSYCYTTIINKIYRIWN